MSHNYLFDTYDYISSRLDHIERILTRADADEDARQYAAGQVEALCEFERFLKANFDIKLPKRLRNRSTRASVACRRLTCSGDKSL